MRVAVQRGVKFVALLLLFAGCDGILREKAGAADVDAPVLSTVPPPPCDEAKTAEGTGVCSGGGQPGDDCLMCHRQGVDGLPFTFAGTLYDAAGTAPVAGATIYVQDALGNVATAVTFPNGNFYSTTGFTMYPAKTFVSLCPDVIEMISPVDGQTGANCNTSGCHTAGFRVRLR